VRGFTDIEDWLVGVTHIWRRGVKISEPSLHPGSRSLAHYLPEFEKEKIFMIPDTHKDLLERPVVVALATVMPDGQPQVNCVWCDYDGTHIRLFTVYGFQKEMNMRKRPAVTILAVDPENPYRYLEVRGRVEEMTEDGVEALADALTQKYTGKPAYFGYVEAAEKKGKMRLVACKIKPKRVITVG
jgi:PPOX class probable F420-dependent enzyme